MGKTVIRLGLEYLALRSFGCFQGLVPIFWGGGEGYLRLLTCDVFLRLGPRKVHVCICMYVYSLPSRLVHRPCITAAAERKEK